MQVQVYLNFNGRCEEAVNFYKTALGANVQMMMRFKDSPQPGPPGSEDKIMHSSFSIGSTTVMAADMAANPSHSGFSGFSLSLLPDNDADAKKYFDALADGGHVHQPLSKTFFASSFGVVADRFGVSWMVAVMLPPPGR